MRHELLVVLEAVLAVRDQNGSPDQRKVQLNSGRLGEVPDAASAFGPRRAGRGPRPGASGLAAVAACPATMETWWGVGVADLPVGAASALPAPGRHGVGSVRSS